MLLVINECERSLNFSERSKMSREDPEIISKSHVFIYILDRILYKTHSFEYEIAI